MNQQIPEPSVKDVLVEDVGDRRFTDKWDVSVSGRSARCAAIREISHVTLLRSRSGRLPAQVDKPLEALRRQQAIQMLAEWMAAPDDVGPERWAEFDRFLAQHPFSLREVQ